MIKKFFNPLTITLMLIVSSCNSGRPKQASGSGAPQSFQPGSFGYDLQFIRQHDSSLVLLQTDSGRAQIIVSPAYQAKVFTSTAEGDSGMSFGWVNYKAFSGPPDPHMNAYGGENRLWLGPEGGRYSLFFKPDSSMVFSNWKTPAAYDSEPWSVTGSTDSSVTLHKAMQLLNYKGTELSLVVDRTVRILNNTEIASQLGISSAASVKAVGYTTDNQLTNTGAKAWTEATGMPCIWMLDMFRPSPATVIVVPFRDLAGKLFSDIATTNYFGEIPPDRLKHTDHTLFFKADGKSRGKLGIAPGYARPLVGSYDAQHQVLTIMTCDLDPAAKYLNQEWNTTKPTFSGDAVNAYNDGPLADGSQMGPFYEIESVSPAALLQPGQSLSHHHSVFHFTGDEKSLDAIAQKLLGVSLETIAKAF